VTSKQTPFTKQSQPRFTDAYHTSKDPTTSTHHSSNTFETLLTAIELKNKQLWHGKNRINTLKNAQNDVHSNEISSAEMS
jgi:hypothetical protein